MKNRRQAPIIINPCAECIKYNDAMNDIANQLKDNASFDVAGFCLEYVRIALDEMYERSMSADNDIKGVVFPDACNSCYTNTAIGRMKRVSLYDTSTLASEKHHAELTAAIVNTIHGLHAASECSDDGSECSYH